MSEQRQLPPGYDDEISLTDLWLVLSRRRAIIAAVLLISAAGGGLYAFSKTPAYAFSTVMEIGTIDSGTPIEAPDVVKTKLEQVYLPPLIAELRASGDINLNAEISTSKGGLLEIKTDGAEALSAPIGQLHAALFAKVEEVHADKLSRVRSQITAQREETLAHLKELQEENAFIGLQLQRVEQTHKTLAVQVGKLQANVEATEAEWQRKLGGLDQGVRPSASLLLVNGLNQTRNRLVLLEERLNVGLPNERSALMQRRSEIQEQISATRLSIAELDAKLGQMIETRLLKETTQSLHPVGPGKPVILALAAVLGAMLGVMAAFFAEFLSKVREVSELDAGSPEPA